MVGSLLQYRQHPQLPTYKDGRFMFQLPDSAENDPVVYIYAPCVSRPSPCISYIATSLTASQLYST